MKETTTRQAPKTSDAEAFRVNVVNVELRDWRKHGLPSLEDL